ncbi:maleylpyruvate isomerase family mycothiol-dependent enzyme [Streptomyces sp. NPDC046928]|uniref:maleylpyruvate isomerase family mycothiol-dependent enzyme n=1 Tax=Streptomyces sp. NPDC046928 TaxID=3155021 RepID=UPI0033FC1B6D
MTPPAFEHHRDAIVTQTERLTAQVRGADLSAPVPTCPGWTLGQLLRHVGGDHRWAEEIVRTRAAGPVGNDLVDDPRADPLADTSTLLPWLTEGAARLSATLRAAGPDALAWNPSADRPAPVRFWARRMAYETAVHRADAALTTGASFTLDAGLAADAVEEWLEFSTFPEAYAPRPDLPDLLGPGRTMRFEAPDAGVWHVDLTGERPALRAGSGTPAATARGPVADLLLYFYRRPAPVVVTGGDTALLDLWRTRAGFWLEAP